MSARPSPDRIGVCLVTDRKLTPDRPPVDVVRAALEGGADLIQIREKDLKCGKLLCLAREIVEASRAVRTRPRIIVNDRLDVALASRAAGVHLPAEGLPLGVVRRHVGKKFLIGRSVHSLAEAKQAEKEGADYVIFGPVFETPAKMAYGPPLGPAALRKVTESVRIPVWAIGGINPMTARDLAGIPVAGLAAISAIASSPDPAEVVRSLKAAYLEGSADQRIVTRRESSRH